MAALAVAVIAALAFSRCAGSGGGATAASGPGVVPPARAYGSDQTNAAASAARDHTMHRTILGPWWGSGCPRNGDCGCGSAQTLAQEFTCQMDELRANDIPVGVYLFDGSGWSERDSRVDGTCEGEDCCAWALGDEVIDRLSFEHVRALVHFWGGCHTPEQYARVHRRLGGNLLGFYLDDGSSDQELQAVDDFMRSVSPGDFENIAKSHQSREPSTTDSGLSRLTNVAYVGDLANDFGGLRDGIARLLEKSSLLPAPMNEFTGYDYQNRSAPDEEAYYRRLHWGAFQPVMAHTPFSNSDPWRPEYGGDLLVAYRYYAWLHKELTPYFLSYARRMHDQPQLPVVQPGPGPDSMLVGEEIFVPYVTTKTPAIEVRLPPGEWVDYWDEERVVAGSVAEQPAPRSREPVFLRLGALIPLEVERDYTGHGTRGSQGSLTVLVYPGGTSSFRYYDDAADAWTTFRSVQDGTRLTLSADSGTRSPVLYRVGRMYSKPSSVGLSGRTVLINQPGSLPELSSETLVNEALFSAWFYDEAAKRVIVKVIP